MKTKDNAETTWLTTSELCSYVKMSRSFAVKFAQQAGAIRKVSSRKNLYDKSLLDKAISRL